MKTLVATFLFLLSSSLYAKTIKIEYVNGSVTSGLENLSQAESMLRDEGRKHCPKNTKMIGVDNVKFSIEGCGWFAKKVKPCTHRCSNEYSFFRCYPRVKASAKIRCLMKID